MSFVAQYPEAPFVTTQCVGVVAAGGAGRDMERLCRLERTENAAVHSAPRELIGCVLGEISGPIGPVRPRP